MQSAGVIWCACENLAIEPIRVIEPAFLVQCVGAGKNFRNAAHARTSWVAFPLSCAPQVRILGKNFRIGKAPEKTSGRIVIRLEPKKGSPVPTYLREASYRFYRVPAWSAGSSRDDYGSVSGAPPDRKLDRGGGLLAGALLFATISVLAAASQYAAWPTEERGRYKT